jgi:hypothetical protein
MGLFDGFSFSPQSTADATGAAPGWLGLMLAAQPGASPGFDAASPMNAAPTNAASMNSPMANGGALLGGIGNLLSPSAAAPSQAAPSFGDRLAAALTGAATARGLIPTLASGIGGFISPDAARLAASAGGDPSAGERASAALMNGAQARGVVPALAGALVGATSGQRIAPPAGHRHGGGTSGIAAPIAGVGPNAGLAPADQAPAAAPDALTQARAAVIRRLQQLGFGPKGP